MFANNEEFIALQKIEKELQADPALFIKLKQNIFKVDLRLLQFFYEFFKQLLSNLQFNDSIQRAIKILNSFLNKQKQKNKDAQIIDLGHYINQKYYDIIANYYEKAILGGIEEANKHVNYIYLKKIVKDYFDSSQNSNQSVSKSILNLIEETYRNLQGSPHSDFEVSLFESLNPEECELFTQIVSDDQNKKPKKSESLFDKFLITLSTDYQERYRNQNCKNVQEFYTNLKMQKAGVEKILGYIFYENLNQYVNQQYLINQTQKVKSKKIELQNILTELEKDLLEQKSNYFSFVEIQYVKYFYKSIKSKKCQQSLQQNFSFRRKLLEFIKQEINASETPKNWKRFQQNTWQEIHSELYINLNDMTTQEDAILQFKIIQSIQQLIIHFFRFRWNYLFLFCIIIVEANFKADQLDNMINIAYEMMSSTTKTNLNIPFGQILRIYNQKAQTSISSIFLEKYGQNLGYDSLLNLESQLKSIHNKIVRLSLVQPNFQNKIKFYAELKNFEQKLINDCRDYLKVQRRVFDQLTDSILDGEKEEKEWKTVFFKSLTFYSQKLTSIFKERPSNDFAIKQQFQHYTYNVYKLKQDYENKALEQFQELFAREEKICSICIQFIQRDIEKIINQNQQTHTQLQQHKELIYNFVDIFYKDNPFIFFLPSLLRGLYYFKPKYPSVEKIERVKFLAVALKDKDQSEINKFFDCLTPTRDQNNFEWQFKISQQIFNFYLNLNIPSNMEYQPLNEQFPNFNQMKTIQDYNSTQFNAICVFTSKFFSQDTKFHLKNEESLRPEFQKKIYQYMKDKSNFESINQDQQIMGQMIQYFNELRHYKQQLIKEATQSGDQNFINKCIELFQKYFQKKSIVSEMMEFKKNYKISLNDVENQSIAQIFLNTVQFQEQKQLDQINKKKLEDYLKQLSMLPVMQIYEKMQKDQTQLSDTYLREIIKKNIHKLKDDLDKYVLKPQQQIKQSIIQVAIINKFHSLKQDPKYKDIQTDDQSVLVYINDQFNLYMKGLLGKVIQSVLTQKPGYEFKVYQNKYATSDTQSIRYKQQIEMQKKYGPNKNQQSDQSLLISTENKPQLIYELCDYTPVQRQVEFRNFLIEIEPQQEEKLKNKIRKNKWKEEHPELEEILKKRIKRGAELWNQVQDFLCKRENNDFTGDSDEESEKVKEQQQQQMENIDDDQLDIKIQDIQRNSERLLMAGKTHIRTRLNNMEGDNPLLTQKVITVKTVQFVLEQHPYFSKSKILYKSYIL
ncbi:unnamed protein product [Paramecium sonneborni]|uniref:Uncharacterized protein n=1 Tax=Paramecium sonneborni TaxID=65129 RepID=A0A8S1LNN6_9CILI|nr:unnamed protein product [Paramecium sonneborni]